MRPAIGKPNVRSDTLRRDQSIVSGIAVNLQNAGESLQYPFCMLSPATGRIGEGNARGSSAAPWTIISRQSPEVSGFGLTGSGIEHRSSGLVHEELARTFQVGNQGIEDGTQFEGGPANPIGKRGAVEVNALA